MSEYKQQHGTLLLSLNAAVSSCQRYYTCDGMTVLSHVTTFSHVKHRTSSIAFSHCTICCLVQLLWGQYSLCSVIPEVSFLNTLWNVTEGVGGNNVPVVYYWCSSHETVNTVFWRKGAHNSLKATYLSWTSRNREPSNKDKILYSINGFVDSPASSSFLCPDIWLDK